MITRHTRPMALLASCAVFFAVLFARLKLGNMALNDDSRNYFTLSLNLLNNGCYSLSDVGTAACQPSWGSQPPGYPLFLVAVQVLIGSLYRDFALAQLCLFAAAATLAIRAAYAWHRNNVAHGPCARVAYAFGG